MAVTDHGNMFGMVKNFNACTTPNDDKATIKPIFGCEVYHCEDRATAGDERYHLVLLAKNDEGLKNLYQIVSDGGLHLFKGRSKNFPRTEEAAFVKHGKGIVALSACIGGIIPHLILEGKYDEAKQKALYYKSIFDDFYLEVQPHEIPEQLIVNSDMLRLSQETGIELVITCDSHYVEKDDKKYHDILKIMAHQKPFTVDAHFKTPEEIEEYCIKYGIPLDAMDNTVKIADMCNVDPRPKDDRGLLPPFPCPKGHTEESYLRELSTDYLMTFVKKKKIRRIKKYSRQLRYELNVICTAGYAGYFLILWDWFLWCRKNGILMGKGRGSAAGSLVSYVLSITTLDPIKNGFMFERFLTPERLEFPDIDSDIAKDKRAEGIGYLLNKYGSDYVSQIITFSEYKLKNTIKAVMSAYNYSYEEANEATKSLPDTIDGETVTYKFIQKVVNDPDQFADLGPKNLQEIVKANTTLEALFNK